MYRSAAAVEGVDRQSCGDVSVKEHIDGLMVENVVVCVENAETVIRCHKRFHNLVVCRIGCLRNALCRRATEPEVVFIVIIELYAVISAGFRYRAAPVRTSSRRAFGRIFSLCIRIGLWKGYG